MARWLWTRLAGLPVSLWIILVPITAAVASWYWLGDVGIVVSLTIATVYVVLLTANLPVDGWIRLTSLQASLANGLNIPIVLQDTCQCATQEPKRHVHISEIVDVVATEKVLRAYGAAKLSEKLIKDVRHDWERGIWTTIVLMALWGIWAFARVNVSGGGPSGPTVASDWVKVGLSATVGLFGLAKSFELLHWFRKQNGQI